MEEQSETSPECGVVAVPESPKPTAFTIDFGDEKKVDVQRQKSLAEKFQQRHKRGKSMSKLDDCNLTPTTTMPKKHPLSGNLPRKSSFQSEDEKIERSKSAKTSSKRSDLTLQLKNSAIDRMTQSFPNTTLPSLNSPDHCDIQNVSSPEFELISPFSPNVSEELVESIANTTLCSEEISQDYEVLSKTIDLDIDKKSDTVSETGTYTVEIDNYSEEQRARMSIDNDFKIEHVSVQKKTEDYILSLSNPTHFSDDNIAQPSSRLCPEEPTVDNKSLTDRIKFMTLPLKSPTGRSFPNKLLSPILSPTQNLSLVEKEMQAPNSPSHRHQRGQAKATDEGAVVSVTSSGAFRAKSEEQRRLERKLSLSKSEIHVEAYVDGKMYNERKLNNARTSSYRPNNLTANIVNVQSLEVAGCDAEGVVSASLVFGKMGGAIPVTSGLPPTPTGKASPTKIPSPLHSLSRPRSRNSFSAPTDDMDTEFILKPTQNYINTLQHKLSLDSDQDSDYEMKYGLQLNNTAHLLKQKNSHIRHNSLDDKSTINNKLEHFQNKNLQSIDQTYSNLLNQYKVVNKINNSPSDSPIRRSSSFSNRNQINQVKSSNLNGRPKETNLCNSPSLGKNGVQNSIQRSSSTASIKPSFGPNGRRIEHKKIDRTQFGDTESSSEEDFDKDLLQKRKDLGNISNTRCNRTFSLRRARLDSEGATTKLRCPNTPEMRRKSFQPEPAKPERAISVDRKSIKTNEVQSRYLLNISKRVTPPPATKAPPKTTSSNAASKTALKSATALSRNEGGRFSMRNLKPPTTNPLAKSSKKDGKNAKQGGGRSNSSLSSREVEFQNWKRRKSYDPMKAAAEGKKKEMQKKLNEMTGSYDSSGRPGLPSPDSSPSHSGSVHRSQSFHGTAALEQLISSDDEDEMTLSADEGLSPPTPSPCELSPTRASLRHALWDKIHNQ
ncbi:uncharacterized protein LOC115882557 isoform X2 [Sitophilus oryzae]|uniref:Uncharacterized protein LOC115882557 isoform X2 n=1 Tax=Sitophilus oryzae TaxID=7048 RepID=A0A6J2XZV4_SITOR|nr:uncharacterized protein LOC115882557 isoform X2 [Sitophilus oryzae]